MRGCAAAKRWGSTAGELVGKLGKVDTNRALIVSEARPRGREEPGSLTKSGRERRVALSSRLHGALRALYRLREEPPAPEAVEIGPPISRLFPPNIELALAWDLVSQSGSGHSSDPRFDHPSVGGADGATHSLARPATVPARL
jgi:hypothetical protein